MYYYVSFGRYTAKIQPNNVTEAPLKAFLSRYYVAFAQVKSLQEA